MLVSSIPTKTPTPWANSAGASYIRTVPVPSQIGIVNGAASWTDGFPPLTFTQQSAGGYPPDGRDFNYALNLLSQWARWSQAGGATVYDSAFSTSVGGYPSGAVINSADYTGWWRSTVDNNTTNPDTGGAGWVPHFFYGSASVALAGANVTLTAAQAAKPLIILTGTLTANVIVTFPAYVGAWQLLNNTTGAFTITVASAGAGASVAIPAGSAGVFSDATNMYLTITGYATTAYVAANYLPLSGGTITGSLTVNNTTTLKQNVSILAPTSGTTLTLTGLSALGFTASPALIVQSGMSYFVHNLNGTAWSTYSGQASGGGLAVEWNHTGSGEVDFISFPGAGSGGFNFYQSNGTGTINTNPSLSVNGAGSVLINQPTSGNGLQVYGASGTIGISVAGVGSGSTAIYATAPFNASFCQTWNSTGGTTNGGVGLSFDTNGASYFGANTNTNLNIGAFGHYAIGINPAGNVTLSPATSGNTLNVQGSTTTTGTAIIGTAITQAAPVASNLPSTAAISLATTGGNGLYIGQNTSANSYAVWMQSAYQVATTAVYPLALQPLGGNVGINTGNTAPGSPLVVQGPSTALGTAVSIPSSTNTYPWSASDGTVQTALYTNGAAGSTLGTLSNSQFALMSNNAQRILISPAGNITFNAATSGYSLVLNDTVGTPFTTSSNINAFTSIVLSNINTGASSAAQYVVESNNGSVISSWQSIGSGSAAVGTNTAHPFLIFTGGANRLSVSAVGAVNVNAPTGANAVTISAVSGYSGINVNMPAGGSSAAQNWTDGTVNVQLFSSSTASEGVIGTSTAHNFAIRSNGADRLTAGPNGNIIVSAPTAGTTFTAAATTTTPSTSFGDATVWGYYAPSATGTNGAVINFASGAITAVNVTSYSSGTVTVKYPGTYYVAASVEVSNGSSANTGTGGIAIYHNGSATNYYATQVTGSGFQNGSVSCSGPIVCAAGDTIAVVAQLANGGQVLTTGQFSGYRIPGL